MKGLALAREYWEQAGLPALRLACPEILEHAAAGLAGEGSDCFGYDDALSRDHDWGPGFCLWLDEEGMARCAETAKKIYAQLPKDFLGFRRINETEETRNRVGVQDAGEFYERLTGLDRAPQSLDEWRAMPEEGLAAATNGEIFFDAAGRFTAVREKLLAYYPEDLRRKKLAMHCALAAQAGQYNYPRCRRRLEGTAAMLAMARFAEHTQSIVFLLNRRYKPYYKWAARSMRELPVLGAELSSKLEALTLGNADKAALIEEIAAAVIGELRAEGLSGSGSDYLLPHAQEIQKGIREKTLREMHLMAE